MVSEPVLQRLKISREGIVLIKSFEGFRPRAVKGEDGRWTIGYGHTLSAREGASVSESDAELLLRYDLLPVEKAVNETGVALNQHQFDALVSFAHSLGLDRFRHSTVSDNVASRQLEAVADAMLEWPERERPETALRRRAAERALFMADPEGAVTLADLLAAPLPAPALVAPVPSSDPSAEDPADAQAEALDEASNPGVAPGPREAAITALIGEPGAAERTVQPELIVPVWGQPDAPSGAPATAPDPTEPSVAEDAANDAVGPTDGIGETTVVEGRPDALLEAEPAPPAPDETKTDETAEAHAPSDLPSVLDRLTLTRYAPYGTAIVGPLPYLQPATSHVPDLPATDVVAPDPSETEASDTDPAVEQGSGPPGMQEPDSHPVEAEPAPLVELVLTPFEDAPEPAVARPLWDAVEREPAPQTDDGSLFGEDLSLTQGTGALIRPEHELEGPVRFDWSETGAFIIMGGVGLTAFGASMAAFRLAAEQSGGNEVTMIAWVLAVIGASCVGVSSFNLYRRLGLPGGD